MGDAIIYGITREYAWTRRRVWFWQAWRMQGWKRDPASSWLLPIMIKEQRRPNGIDPFSEWAKREP